MPLHELDPNLARRNSKSSAASVKTVGDASRGVAGVPAGSNDAGVLSMLRTGTETGDLGAFSMTSGRFPKIPKPASSSANRNGAPSAASSQYSRHNSVHGSVRSAKSQRSAHSVRSTRDRPPMPGEWPYAQHPSLSQRDYSHPQSDARSSMAQESVRSMPLSGHDSLELQDRSYSLTHAPYPHGHLNMQASMTSLRSQPDYPPSRPRPQFMAGPRLPNVGQNGYRPASPALSDTAGVFSGQRPTMRPPPGPRSYTASPGPSSHSYRGIPRYDLPQQVRPRPTIDDLKRSFMSGGYVQGRPSPPPLRPTHKYSASRAIQHPRQPSVDDSARLPTHSHRSHGSNASSPLEEALPRASTPANLNTVSSHLHGGFVQRVKNVLEERMTAEQHTRSQRALTPTPGSDQLIATPTRNAVRVNDESTVGHALGDNEQDYDLPKHTKEGVVEIEHQTEREQADGEGHDDHTPTIKRLTRDLIKAGMDGMSDIVANSDAADETRQDSLSEDDTRGVGGPPHNDILSNGGESSDFPDDDRASEQQEQPNPRALPLGSRTTLSIEEQLPGHDGSTFAAPSSLYDVSSSSPEATGRYMPAGSAEDNRRTYPFRKGSDHSTERPLSMPSEPSQEIRPPAVDSLRGRFVSGQSLKRPENPISGPNVEEEQHAINLDDLEASSHPQGKAPQPKREGAPTLNVESPTRVTILSNSPDSTASDVPSLTMPDDHGRHDRRFRPSSLGTVDENESEATVGYHAKNDSTEVTLPQVSTQNTPQAESSRRGASDAISSAMRNFHFPLPDLAEDSQEDASTTNLRMLGHRGPGFRGRMGFKDPRRLPRPTQSASVPPEPIKSYFGRTLRDTHNLPSLNFSQGNLTATMNAALGFRNSRSLEDLPNFKFDETSSPPRHDRPMSTSLIRERYRSFFVLEHDHVDNDAASDGHPVPVEGTVTKSSIREEQLLGEIERLSIPSVKDLSLRLSELFPSIRSSEALVDLDRVDAALTRTVQEIRGNVTGRLSSYPGAGLGSSGGGGSSSAPVTRRCTLTSNVSIVVPMKSRERERLRLNKDLPPLPKDPKSAASTESSDDAHYESADNSNGYSVEYDTSEEGSSARDASEGDRDTAHANGIDEDAKIDSKTLHREAPSSPGATPRPWNNPENYPWSEGSETADVTLSSSPPDLTQNTSKMSKHKLQRSRSSPNIRRGDNTLRVIRSMSPGFGAELVPNSMVRDSDQLNNPGKKGVLRSLSRKKGKSYKTEPAIDPRFFHPEEQRNSAVNPGDRYPTSALQQPPGLSIDESRSYFSDDSDDEGRGRGSRRRRFTRLKGKRSMPGIHASPNPSQTASHPEYRRTPNPDSMVFVDAPHAPDEEAVQDRPPGGMSKAEFHAKRIVEKLRFFFFRGGEVLRHFSKGKRGRDGRGEIAPYT